MPIKFYCPKCSKKIAAPEAVAGRTGKCPKCGTSVDIPTRSTAADSEKAIAPDQAAQLLRQELQAAAPTPPKEPDLHWQYGAAASAGFLLLGVMLPWVQLGALFVNRGINNPDGTLLLVFALLSGGVAVRGIKKKTKEYSWVHLVVGGLSTLIAFGGLVEVNDRAQKMAEAMQGMPFVGSEWSSSLQYVGSGLYVCLLAAIGLAVCGYRIRFDGTILNRDTGPKRSTEPENMRCPSCFKIFLGPAPTCPYCHAAIPASDLDGGNTARPTATAPFRFRKWAIGGGVALLLVIGISTLFGQKLNPPKQQKASDNADLEIGLLTRRVEQLEQDKKALADQLADAKAGENKLRDDMSLIQRELVETRKAAAKVPTAKLVGPDNSSASTENARLRAELTKAQREAENQKQIYEKELQHWKGIGSMFLAAAQKLDANSKQALTDACKSVVTNKEQPSQPEQPAQTNKNGTHHLADESGLILLPVTAGISLEPTAHTILTYQSMGSSGVEEDNEGKWVLLEKGVQVKFVKREYNRTFGVAYFVQILSGKHAGKEGWINEKRLLKNE